MDQLLITNPKRRPAAQGSRDQWFPYYAGFSSEFAKQVIASSGLAKGSALMDPWNGSGTTTSAATLNGYRALGFDLNPVMAVVAKGRLLPESEIASIIPLLADILKKAAASRRSATEEDPLLIWFVPDAVTAIRRIERAVYGLLVIGTDDEVALRSVQKLSCLAAFFYVSLFRTVRFFLHGFMVSNPTWITRPRSARSRVRPDALRIRECFENLVIEMVSVSFAQPAGLKSGIAEFTLGVASSDKLPVKGGVIDFVLSSPPYCTRIDYGIATSAELAVLGLAENRLREFRTGFIGTPTIHKDAPDLEESWGDSCLALLKRIRHHPSKAAKSYYYKTYIQYFAAMSQSFSELGRCLKPRAQCVLVVQDSYFKDTHIDLPTIFAEMALSSSLALRRQVDFPIERSFASVNSKSRKYRKASFATESVLCFVRTS